MEHFDEVKNNPTNSANISKMLMAKFETYLLSIEHTFCVEWSRLQELQIIAETQRGLNTLVGVARSPKFQALQVQLLVKAISTQIFSENTMILLALH